MRLLARGIARTMLFFADKMSVFHANVDHGLKKTEETNANLFEWFGRWTMRMYQAIYRYGHKED